MGRLLPQEEGAVRNTIFLAESASWSADCDDNPSASMISPANDALFPQEEVQIRNNDGMERYPATVDTGLD